MPLTVKHRVGTVAGTMLDMTIDIGRATTMDQTKYRKLADAWALLDGAREHLHQVDDDLELDLARLIAAVDDAIDRMEDEDSE